MVMCDEFSAETVIDILSHPIGDLACALLMAVPTMYLKLMEGLKEKRRDFSHLRLLASGSAPLLPKDFERIKVEARIVNPETFKDLASGEVGEIWLKGPNVTPGYWGKPRETEAVFVNGWFRTGDLGKRDEDGYYYITDRLKHIIISGGENISPKEIESVINQHQNVSESCVIGVPDEKWGEKVVAAVVLKPGAPLAAKEIQDHCKRHLLDWKCPKEVFFLEELPRNKMGKIPKEEVTRLVLNLFPLHKSKHS
jgi:malonyl-CoA/methylmalonyl-CoA synthetase